MSFCIVQSKQNARLKDLRHALARPVHAPGALAGVEGPNLVGEAVRSGLRIRAVYVEAGFEHLVDSLGITPEADALVMSRPLLCSALTTEAPQPIAALVEQPGWHWLDLLSGPSPLIIVLAGLQDPGNLGTILRSAEAFGATGIVALPGTVCPWNPKAIRASAGSLFRLPLLAAEPDDCFQQLRGAGARILTTAMRAAQPAPLANLANPVAILIGNEGNGVPSDLASQADSAISIPCPGPVESLNAAVAASVLLYEASRQRAAKEGSQ